MFSSTEDLCARLKAAGCFIDTVMIQVEFLAAKLQKPLLLEGPAGSGKAQTASSIRNRNATLERQRPHCILKFFAGSQLSRPRKKTDGSYWLACS
jgi:sigma54-dependent transcription regulator